MPRLTCECSAVLVDGLCPVCEGVKLALRQSKRLKELQAKEARRAVRIDIGRDNVMRAAARIDPTQARRRLIAQERAARGNRHP